MVYELRFKLKHNCPFLKLAEYFNPKIAYGYCTRSHDVLSLPSPIESEQMELAREIFPNVDDWTVSNVKGQVSYIRMPCQCEELYKVSITGLIQATGALIKYPISYEKGWELYNVLAFDTEVHKKVIRNLQSIDEEDYEFEIISINDLGVEGLFKSQMISVPELFRELTTHQISILLDAFERGYYAIPRSIRTKDIAEKNGVSRYAIDKVLRTAENSLINSLVPYLYFKLHLAPVSNQ